MGSPESQPHNIDYALLDRILYELRTYQREDDPEVSIKINQLFGNLLQDSLDRRGCSRETFTKALDLEREFTDALLDGWFPVSEIEDDFLEELATFVGQSPDIFKAILQFQKPTSPQKHRAASAPPPAQKPCTEPARKHPQAFLRGIQLNESV